MKLIAYLTAFIASLFLGACAAPTAAPTADSSLLTRIVDAPTGAPVQSSVGAGTEAEVTMPRDGAHHRFTVLAPGYAPQEVQSDADPPWREVTAKLRRVAMGNTSSHRGDISLDLLLALAA